MLTSITTEEESDPAMTLIIAACLQQLKGEEEHHHKLQEAKEMRSQRLENLVAGARSLEEALKWRSAAGSG